MARIKVKVVEVDGVRKVMLPSYNMTEEPKDNMVVVEVPDDEVTDGKLDLEKIRKKYKGNPLWDREDALKDV